MQTLWQGFIPTDSLDTLDERLAKVVKRATRIGFPVPTMTLGGTRQTETDKDTFIEETEVTIEASDYLRLSGWKLLGTVAAIEVDGRERPFVTFAPGVERLDVSGVLKVNWCDHCETYRNRKDTFLVTDEHGSYIQVGSSCIKDFLGHSPDEIVGYLTALGSLGPSDSEVDGWRTASARFYRPAEVLRIAASIVAKTGFYKSRAKAEEEGGESTGATVRFILSARGDAARQLANNYPFNEDAERILTDTLEAIATADTASDWLVDIKRLAAAEGIQWRHVAILASAVILGLRKQERRATEARPASHYVGTVGERLTLPVTVTMKRSFESAYGGSSYIIRMATAEGNDLLWWASWSETSFNIQEGHAFTLTGTVKAHEVDKFTKRETTTLTRCKVA